MSRCSPHAAGNDAPGRRSRSPDALVAGCLDRHAVGLALASIGASGLLLGLPVATPGLRIVLALLWIGLWFVCAGAVLRAARCLARHGDWPRLWPLGVAWLLFLLAAVRLAGSSFAIDDELTSWNYWAIQHALGQPPDFSYTQAAYPQLFAAWIGSIYRVVGSFEWQSVARLTVALVTLLLGLLMLQAGAAGGRRGAWLAALLLVAFWFDGFRQTFTRGLADPLMTVALLASVHYFLCFAAEPARRAWLGWAALSAVVASFSKQPALLWGCLELPLFCIWGVWRRGWPRWTLFPAIVAAGASLSWPLWFGRGFQHNHGVIARSLDRRGWLPQLGHSAQLYLLEHPVVLLLLGASLVACWSRPLLRSLWLLLLLPLLLAWFVWGSYALRLGLHVEGLAGLLWLHALRDRSRADASSEATLPCGPKGRWTAGLAMLVLIGSLGLAAAVLSQAARAGRDLRHGSVLTIDRYFGEEAPVILGIYRSRAPVWVSSNYLNGMFHGNNPVLHPSDAGMSYPRRQLLADLAAGAAEYAFSGGRVPYGPASATLLRAAADCPAVFHEIVHGDGPYGFRVFRVDAQALRRGTCHD